MEPWEYAAGVLERQHSLITTWQFEAVGLSRRMLAHRVRHQAWPRYYRGVTGLPGPDSPDRRLAAIVLAYGRPTAGASRIEIGDKDLQDPQSYITAVVDAVLKAGQALSGRTGACRHGFGPQPKQHELWLPHQSGRVLRDGVRLRYGGDRAGEIQFISGLPTLDPAGCIIETARTPIGTRDERVDELIWQLARAHARRLITLDAVEERLHQLNSCCGGEILQLALDKARGRLSHSKAEDTGRLLAAKALEPLGLRVEPQPHAIYLSGHRVAEADIAVVAIRLDLEVDGPHHRFVDQQREDQERDRLVRRATWEVERFPDDLVKHRPKLFMARVREAAEARQQQLQR